MSAEAPSHGIHDTHGGRDGSRHEPVAPAHGRQYDHNPANPSYGERKGGFGKGGENETDPTAILRGDSQDEVELAEEVAKPQERMTYAERLKKEQQDAIKQHEEAMETAQDFSEYMAQHADRFAITATTVKKVARQEKLPADLLALGPKNPSKRKEQHPLI
ncbi:hypothetical protein GMRT_10222 [Giardia muris]|uniref:Uncharacterized protein n=1 Tax=Giardia muris TaxID=5742 RepID=A0A4Z1SXD9_GIAMU|nr:hypothetical protein GMRT_10222 [Giardia muris]|eukprot:TNJ29485.1 hypothetical protein GMRT_10222 [Giardia muris]